MAKRRATGSVPDDTILQSHAPDVQAVTKRLRTLVRETLPEATESGHAVWHSINYNHPENGYICGIFPHQDGVNLVFEFGVLLPDPDGVLKGSGKQTRHILVREGEEIPALSIRSLLLAAVALPASRAERVALVRSLT